MVCVAQISDLEELKEIGTDQNAIAASIKKDGTRLYELAFDNNDLSL